MRFGGVLFTGALFVLPIAFVSAQSLALTVRDAATVYYYSDGLPFRLTADWISKTIGEAKDPVAARLVAPDGEIVGRLETDLVKTGQSTLEWRVEVKAPLTGNYRLVWTAFQGDLRVETEPGLPFAFSGHADGLMLPDGESRFYFLVPPGMKELALQLRGGAVLRDVRNEAGERVPFSQGVAPKGNVSGHAGEIWSLSVAAAGGKSCLGFAGVAPVPLAFSAEAARAVGGAIKVLDENVICFFPWQVEAWKLLDKYRKLPASAFDVPLPDLTQFASEWEAEPARNSLLFGPGGDYANLKPVLAEQNLNPESPWFGSIWVWRDFKSGGERPAHPAQFYRREEAFGKDFGSGSSKLERRNRGGIGVHQSQQAAIMASVYVVDAKFNPLYKNPALLNRIVIAMLQDLMMVRPSELLDPRVTSYYGGNRVFHFTRFTRAFSLIGPYLPEREKRIIGQGMRAVADRLLVGKVGLTTNQWSFIPAGLYQVYQGSGDERYRDWARRHVGWILQGETPGDGVQADTESGGGLQPAGYHTEAGGPDATYNGLTLTHLALLAREMDDPAILESVRKSYVFFNHTIVPHPLDPAKPGFGAFDFAHRTPGSWWIPQDGGGLVFMADRLPEAGLRAGLGWFPDPQSPDALRLFREQFAYNPETFFNDSQGGAARVGSGRHMSWKLFPAEVKKGLLPAEESGEFFRNFGGEFFAARRGDYYAMVYAGNTQPSWLRSRVKDDIRAQFPQNGGGLGLLWSREAGPSLIGRNFGAYAAHQLIARKDGREFKNDYWATRVLAFDPENWTLAIEGKMANLPLSYVRTYRFGPESIEVELEISASEDVRLEAFQEVLPLTQEKGFAVEAWVGGQSMKAEPLADVSEIRLRSSLKPGSHRLVLSPPRIAQRINLEGFSRYGMSHAKKGGNPLSPLALDLPLAWKAGQSGKFSATFFFEKPIGE